MRETSDRQAAFVRVSVIVSVILAVAQTGLAQTTAFNYQGKLTEAGNPANGNYDMQFALFDTPHEASSV